MTTLNWWIISSNLEYYDVIRRNASGPNQQPERSAPLGAWSSSSPWWSSARSALAFRSRSQGIGDDDDDDDDDDDGDDNDEEPLREVHLPPEADHKVLALSITTRCQFWHALLVFKFSEAFFIISLYAHQPGHIWSLMYHPSNLESAKKSKILATFWEKNIFLFREGLLEEKKTSPFFYCSN